MVPAMPAAFVLVWLAGLILFGWIGWRTKKEGWFVVAFVWMLFVGPLCWLMVGAATS